MDSFAPIIIPTLNRYDHFKRCVESLSANTFADETDLIIGLDYPPSERYLEGYSKIKKYIETIVGFKRVIVLSSTVNLNAYGNYTRLINYVRESGYKSFIFSEDDNEFSPNFLEYMNWALEEFEEDDSIYAVCGFKRIDVTGLKNNVYKYPKFSAWGYGQWIKRREKLDKFRDLDYLKKYLDRMSIWSVFTNEYRKGISIIGMLKERAALEDNLPKFLPKNEMFCLFPAKSMVRNYGHDGLGIHGGTDKMRRLYENMEIDKDIHFIPRVVEDLYQPSLDDAYSKTYPINIKNVLKGKAEFFLYKATGFVIDHKIFDPWYRVRLRRLSHFFVERLSSL